MPAPLFVLCIPGVALFFLVQLILCHAYHFQITVAREKNYHATNRDNKIKSEEGKRNNIQQPKKDNTTATKSPMKPQDDDNLPEKTKNYSPAKKDVPQTWNDSNSESDDETQGVEDESSVQGWPNTVTNQHCFSLQAKLQSLFTKPFANTYLVVPDDSPVDRFKSRRKSVFAESYDPSKDDDSVKVIHPKSPEEKQWIIENLNNVTLFRHLAMDQKVTVADAMYKHPVLEGETIMKQGDRGSTFYVIQKGLYDVFTKGPGGQEKLMHTYYNQGSFGELALLYNQPRSATIKARSDGTLWVVDGLTFRRIVHKITHDKRMMYENLIQNVPMLKPLEAYERANLVDALVPMTFENDQRIIKQGDEADGMYFIIYGNVRIIMRKPNGKESKIKELGQGDFFGELALVENKPRAASAYSVGTSSLAFLDRDAFERLLGPCMDVIKRHIDHYTDRLSEALVNNS